MARFQYDGDRITAYPDAMDGPGWDAVICGHHAVGCGLTIL